MTFAANAAGKENTVSGAGILPVVNKKLIANSLNVLFDLLSKSGSKELTKQVSGYLMAAVYRMFRIVYSFGPKNNMNTFSIPKNCALESADAYMKSCEARAKKLEGSDSVKAENLSAGSLDLTVSTGNIAVTGISCSGDISIKVSTGRIDLNGVKCQSLVSTGNTGNVYLNNVTATKMLSVERSTGDVRFNDCDAGEIFITTDTGDVSGTLLSEKIFLAKSDTGKIDVPKTVTGGRCEITTSTGNIKITVS